MTNWLLLISASTMMIFLQTCGRKPADSETTAIADTSKTIIIYDSSTNVVDTVRFDSSQLTDSSGTVPADEAGTKTGKTEKVPATNPVKKDIPDHRSPDQAKIDSIKKAKEKLKKKSDDGEEEDKG